MLSDNPIFRRFWAWRYDGTNAAAIVASANEWQTARGGGAVWDCPIADAAAMTLRQTNTAWGTTNNLIVPMGQWLLCNGDDGPSEIVTNGFYERVYRPLAELWTEMTAATRLMADPTFVAAVKAASVQASFLGVGVGKLAAILLGTATATVDSQVRPVLPAALAGTAVITASALAGGINILGSTNQGNVPTSTVGGVTTLAHTLVRTTVQGTGLTLQLGTPAVLATVHV